MNELQTQVVNRSQQNTNVNNSTISIDKSDTIDLMDVLHTITKHIALIIVLALVGAVIGFGVTKYAITPMYEASVNMIVNTANSQYDNTNPNYVSNDSINSAENLVDSYSIIIKSNRVAKAVITELNLDVSVDDLIRMIDVASINGTQVMKVTVTSDSAEKSAMIVQKISEIAPQQIVDAVKAGSCEVVSDIATDENPVSPSIVKNTMLGLLLGLIIGVAYALIREMFNNKIVDDKDLKKYVDIPVLAVLPDVEQGKGKKVTPKTVAQGKAHRTGEELRLIIDNKVPFNYSEAFKALRTNISFIANTQHIKTFMVTSSIPYESKTNTAINLAVSLATAGKSVVIVDADLRKPAVAKYLKVSRKIPGISDILSGNCELDDALIFFKDLKVYALTSGQIPPNPSELLASPELGEIFTKLENMFDYVIIDTPPVNLVADACIVGEYADEAILVVRSDFATYDTVQNAKAKLDGVNTKFAGSVLTVYNPKNYKQGYYYEYDYDYSYREKL